LIVSCAAAVACSCCIGLSFQCCGLALTLTKSIATRVMYTFIFLVIAIISWVFGLYGYDVIKYIPYIKDSCEEETCGVFSIYRITFALFVFHALLSILLIGVKNSKDARAKINDAGWIIKLPFLVILILLDFIIPNEFFTAFAWVSLFGAGVFILIQLVLLVDFAYSWSESWVAKYEPPTEFDEPNKKWFVALLGSTLFLYGVALGFDVLMYAVFCRGDCWWNSLIITAVLLGCLCLTIFSLHPRIREFNPRVGLLQASVFTVYCTYYVYSAILSEPTCGALPFSVPSLSENSLRTNWIALIFGAMFTVVSVVYASVRAGSSNLVPKKSKDTLITEADKSNDSEEAGSEELEEDEEEGYQDDELTECSYNYALFHLAFALGSMYLAMLLTNWSVVTGESETAETDSGWMAVSIKLASCCLAAILYTWTIFAPAILPNRDWEL